MGERRIQSGAHNAKSTSNRSTAHLGLVRLGHMGHRVRANEKIEVDSVGQESVSRLGCRCMQESVSFLVEKKKNNPSRSRMGETNLNTLCQLPGL